MSPSVLLSLVFFLAAAHTSVLLLARAELNATAVTFDAFCDDVSIAYERDDARGHAYAWFGLYAGDVVGDDAACFNRSWYSRARGDVCVRENCTSGRRVSPRHVAPVAHRRAEPAAPAQLYTVCSFGERPDDEHDAEPLVCSTHVCTLAVERVRALVYLYSRCSAGGGAALDDDECATLPVQVVEQHEADVCQNAAHVVATSPGGRSVFDDGAPAAAGVRAADDDVDDALAHRKRATTTTTTTTTAAATSSGGGDVALPNYASRMFDCSLAASQCVVRVLYFDDAHCAGNATEALLYLGCTPDGDGQLGVTSQRFACSNSTPAAATCAASSLAVAATSAARLVASALVVVVLAACV